MGLSFKSRWVFLVLCWSERLLNTDSLPISNEWRKALPSALCNCNIYCKFPLPAYSLGFFQTINTFPGLNLHSSSTQYFNYIQFHHPLFLSPLSSSLLHNPYTLHLSPSIKLTFKSLPFISPYIKWPWTSILATQITLLVTHLVILLLTPHKTLLHQPPYTVSDHHPFLLFYFFSFACKTGCAMLCSDWCSWVAITFWGVTELDSFPFHLF